MCNNVYCDDPKFTVCGFIKTRQSKYLENETFFFQRRQKFGDHLTVCVLNFLPKVCTLQNVVAINLVKVEI